MKFAAAAYPSVMQDQHPDSPALDRIGTKAIKQHFDVTDGAISNWRKRGVPRTLRRPLALLGKVMGHEMPELPDPVLPNAG